MHRLENMNIIEKRKFMESLINQLLPPLGVCVLQDYVAYHQAFMELICEINMNEDVFDTCEKYQSYLNDAQTRTFLVSAISLLSEELIHDLLIETEGMDSFKVDYNFKYVIVHFCIECVYNTDVRLKFILKEVEIGKV